MGKKLRRPSVRGSTDPELPGHVLVPVRKGTPGLPKVNYSVPDDSFWRVDTRTNRPTAILTMTPSGMPLGWDNCGVCTGALMVCTCPAGISLPNAIGYIFTTFGGTRPIAPEPQPFAAVFRPPVARKPKKMLKRPSVPAKKLLRRPSVEQAAVHEAEAVLDRALKRLKRK